SRACGNDGGKAVEHSPTGGGVGIVGHIGEATAGKRQRLVADARGGTADGSDNRRDVVDRNRQRVSGGECAVFIRRRGVDRVAIWSIRVSVRDGGRIATD